MKVSSIVIAWLVTLVPSAVLLAEQSSIPASNSPMIETKEEIQVVSPEFYDVKTTELSKGETVDLEVILQSAGDPLAGFPIEIYDVGVKRVFATQVSDDSGVSIFRGVKAGKYRVYLVRTDQQRSHSSVKVADALIHRRR